MKILFSEIFSFLDYYKSVFVADFEFQFYFLIRIEKKSYALIKLKSIYFSPFILINLSIFSSSSSSNTNIL